MSIRSLEVLSLDIRSCTSCQLSNTRSNAVVGQGPPDASVLLLGEAPGAKEDESGLPFQGMSGRLLTDALSKAGLPRDSVRISNVVRCRPPANRVPTPVEMSACKKHLEEEIQLVSPRVIITLGASPARALGVLGLKDPLSSIRGTASEITVCDVSYRVLSTVHPAYALRSRVKVLPVLIDDLSRARSISLGDNSQM